MVVLLLSSGRGSIQILSFTAMSLFSCFLLLLLILVEAAPPTASSIPTLGEYNGPAYAGHPTGSVPGDASIHFLEGASHVISWAIDCKICYELNKQ